MSWRTLISVLLLLSTTCACGAADWSFFRGSNRDGKSDDAQVPLEWGKGKNIKWRVKLPQPGNSSAVVTGGKVLVACALDRKGTQRALFCFDRTDGKQLWIKSVTWDQADPTHDANPYCGSTPATDGQRVIVWHGSAGVYCYDLNGKQLWQRDLGIFRHIWGYAGSPVIHGERVFLNCGPGTRSFVVALDKKTGEILWQTDEPGGAPDKDPQHPDWLGSWSTPVVTTVDGQEQLLVFQPLHVNGYDLQSGKILWHCAGTGLLAYTDVVVGEVDGAKIAVAMAGYGGKAIGFHPGGSGDITAERRLWQSTARPPQRIGSGIIVGKHLFIINEPGAECIDPLTGKTVWNQRLPGQVFWSSLVSTPGRLYATSQQGKTFVFAADPTGWKLLATNDLGERINATPAVSDGQLFIRSWEALYCVGG
jgi:outer membrane protein assembly factor BamB